MSSCAAPSPASASSPRWPACAICSRRSSPDRRTGRPTSPETRRVVRSLVCLVTDRTRVSPDARTARDEILALERWLDDAIDAGVDLIQIRERDLEGGPLRALARALVAAHTRYRARSCSSTIARTSRWRRGADGVHLRADGPPVDACGRLARAAGSSAGRSTRRVRRRRLRRRTICCSARCSRARPSPTAPPLRASAALRAAVEAAGGVPVLAIGGITAERAARVPRRRRRRRGRHWRCFCRRGCSAESLRRPYGAIERSAREVLQ